MHLYLKLWITSTSHYNYSPPSGLDNSLRVNFGRNKKVYFCQFA